DRRLPVAVVFVDQLVVRHDAQQVELLLFDLLADAVAQLAIRRAVDDQPDALRLQPQLTDQTGDAARRLHAAARTVADEDSDVDRRQDAAADVLHAGLVVHDDIGIVPLQLLHLRLQQAVDVAVAARAL